MESSQVPWVTLLVKDQCRNGGRPKSLKSGKIEEKRPRKV